jgi:2-octaprenyl-6-methoxyphenol hydroxylase
MIATESGAAGQTETEIAIVGGGMVGLTLALALDQAGLAVTVLDAAPPATQLEARFDGRASAIAFASFRMWKTLGVADRLAGDFQRIENIVVTDGRVADDLRAGGPSALRLHFDRRELDDAPEGEALGYMVENRAARRALMAEVAARPNLTLIAPARVISTNVGEDGVDLILGSGARISAALAISAEGKTSSLRKIAGANLVAWNYPQTAIVCTIAHDRAHGGVAHEYFLPAGPFALLPLTQNRMNIVWTEKSQSAKALLAMNEADFLAELRRRVGDFLGAVRLDGPRFSYPLGLQIADRYIAPRIALVGDAAHSIHPIAGQGLNMGLRDVAALAECVSDAARQGLDVSDFTALERYQAWRRFDNVSLALATDGFNRLFSNDFGRIRLVRDLGMAAVARIGLARRFFMREAGGGVGDLPKLLRGESLAA